MLLQGLTLDAELELLLDELLMLDDELELLVEELLLDELTSTVGEMLGLLLLPLPPPQAVKRVNIPLNKIRCFNINLPFVH